MYRYVIQDGRLQDPFMRKYAWFVRQTLDVEAMARARAVPASAGTTSAASRRSGRTGSPACGRSRTCAVNRFGEFIWIDVEADGFLYNMVRAIAGSLVQVGRGFWPESQIADVLTAMDRRLAGPTAPPEGLFLMRVTYEPMSALTYPAELAITPLAKPPTATVTVPGSKSITNRALVLAALTASARTLSADVGAPKRRHRGDDRVLSRSLGFAVETDWDASPQSRSRGPKSVNGEGDYPPLNPPTCSSPTPARRCGFSRRLSALGKGGIASMACHGCGSGPSTILLDALRKSGVNARSESGNGCPPVIDREQPASGRVGHVRVQGEREQPVPERPADGGATCRCGFWTCSRSNRWAAGFRAICRDDDGHDAAVGD